MGERTYDWNGHTGLPISYPDLTDAQMAGTVRMLMRHDLHHEGIVCGARDRIMCLVKESAAKDAEIAKLREALEEARNVLAMMIHPDTIMETTVINAYASATAAEAKARAALKGGEA